MTVEKLPAPRLIAGALCFWDAPMKSDEASRIAVELDALADQVRGRRFNDAERYLAEQDALRIRLRELADRVRLARGAGLERSLRRPQLADIRAATGVRAAPGVV
jgi:hypothetical protein